MPVAFPAMAAIATDAMLRPMLTMSETLSLVLAMLLGFGVVLASRRSSSRSCR